GLLGPRPRPETRGHDTPPIQHTSGVSRILGTGRRRRAMSYLGLTPGALEAWPAEARELAFDREEYLGRLRRVRALMAEQRVDLLYVTTPDHVCYLHGYFASWYKANSPMRYPQLYGTA